MTVVTVAWETVNPLPTLAWLKLPVYGPDELTDKFAASEPRTPANVCVPIAAITPAAVVSYTLFWATKPELIVNGAGVMLAAKGAVKPVIT